MEQLDKIDKRVTELENWRHRREIADGRTEERGKHMDERFDRLEGQIAGINGNISKVLWIFAAGVLAALAKFVLAGGLNV